MFSYTHLPPAGKFSSVVKLSGSHLFVVKKHSKCCHSTECSHWSQSCGCDTPWNILYPLEYYDVFASALFIIFASIQFISLYHKILSLFKLQPYYFRCENGKLATCGLYLSFCPYRSLFILRPLLWTMVDVLSPASIQLGNYVIILQYFSRSSQWTYCIYLGYFSMGAKLRPILPAYFLLKRSIGASGNCSLLSNHGSDRFRLVVLLRIETDRIYRYNHLYFTKEEISIDVPAYLPPRDNAVLVLDCG